MGATVASTTVASKTIEHDDDLLDEINSTAGTVPSVAFNSFGTGPALTSLRGGAGRLRMRVTSGSGTPSAAANNVVLTCGRAPRKVFLAVTGTATPNFYATISSNDVRIGSQTAAAASTAYDFELIVLF